MNYKEKLYSKYVSEFKSNNNSISLSSSDKKWFFEKYIKILSHKSFDINILELGSGPGTLMDLLKEKGYKNLKGVDISKEQIEIAKNKGHNVELNDVIAFLESNDKVYDTVYALDFIEHLNKEELLFVFEKIKVSLVKDGYFILRTPNADGLFSKFYIYGDLTHSTILNPSSLQQLANYAGFSVIKIEDSGPVPFILKSFPRYIFYSITKFIINIFRILLGMHYAKNINPNMICYLQKK